MKMNEELKHMQTANIKTLDISNPAINHKFVLGIDSGWYFRSRIAVIAKNPNIDLSFESRQDIAKTALMSKWTLDLCNELNKMSWFVDDVVLCIDDAKAKLWRSHEPIPKITDFVPDFKLPEEVTEDAGYKGTRVYDTAINWLECHKVFQEWIAKMRQAHGIKAIKVDSAEADDVLAMTSRWCNSVGRNFCYMGTDKDLIQLVGSHPETGAMTLYCMVKNGCKANNWAKTRLLTCSSANKAALKSLGAFRQPQQIQSIFDEQAGSKTPINPYDAIVMYSDNIALEDVPSFVWYKIVLGDSGDNVPELFAWMKQRGSKQAHMQVGMIYDTLKELGIESDMQKPLDAGLRHLTIEDLYDEDFIKKFCQIAYCNFLKVEDCPANMLEWLLTRFKQSRHMMFLSYKELPEPILHAYRGIASSLDWQHPSCNVQKLCNFQETVQALELGAGATVDRSQQRIDTQFADDFVSGLFGK